MHASYGVCRRISACVLAAFVVALVAATPALADCPFADATPGTATPDQIAAATVCLLNEQRAAAGLKPLAPSVPLANTATGYAAYMVSTDHFAHLDEDGHNVVYRVLQTDPSQAGLWQVIGENLGWGTYSLATPRSMVQGWMNSATHRDNILYPDYDSIGVGIAQGAPVPGQTDGLTYATVFGQLAPPDPPAATEPAPAPPKPKKHAKHRRAKKGKARAAHHHHSRAAHR